MFLRSSIPSSIVSYFLTFITAIILTFSVFPNIAIAAKTPQYAPPLSYSNAQLAAKNFSHQSLQKAEFSNANLENADFSGADLTGAVLSASSLTNTNLHGANLNYALVDQVRFVRADLSDAIFTNAMMLRSIFEDVNITGADFTDALLGKYQVSKLCQVASGTNSITGVSTRESLGCPN